MKDCFLSAIFLFSTLGISACAMKHEKSTLPFNLEQNYKDWSNRNLIRWRAFTVANDHSADEMLSSLESGVIQISAPSIDPYSGRDSVPPDCQTANLPEIKKARTECEISIMVSLFSSQYSVIGCLGKERIRTQSLLLYCRTTKKLYSIVALFPDAKDWPVTPVANCGCFLKK